MIHQDNFKEVDNTIEAIIDLVKNYSKIYCDLHQNIQKISYLRQNWY